MMTSPQVNKKAIATPAGIGVAQVNYWHELPKTKGYFLFYTLFIVFLASMPFHRYSLISTFSVDNLLAPLCCLAALIAPRGVHEPAVRVRRETITAVIILFGIFVLCTFVTFLQDSTLVKEKAWLGLRKSFYLLAPVLLIRDRWAFEASKVMFIFSAMCAAISVLLSALGIIELEIIRFADSRVGVDWLPKAIGLYSRYGDMAILYAATIITLLTSPKGALPFGMSTKIGKMFIGLVLFAGIAGAQSRNVVFTVIVAFAIFYATSWLVKERSARVRRSIILLGVVGMFMSSALFVGFFSVFTDALSSVGGDAAYNTAQTRLESYARALSLIWNNFFFGVSLHEYRLYGGLTEGVHNMWIQIMLKGGVIGLAAWFSLLLMCIGTGLKFLTYSPTENAKWVLSVSLAILFSTQFNGGLSDTVYIMIGFLLSYRWIVRQEMAQQ